MCSLRGFFLTLALFTTCRLHAADPPHSPPSDPRPNFLIVFADDWGQYASIYAKLEPGGINDVVNTPHFDRVAREGVLFPHAFVNAPSCTPCRSSLLSGQHFWRTGLGAILQGAQWDNKIPTFPLLLEKSGYAIGHSAKVWSPGTPANAPYGAAAFAFNQAGNRFNGFSQQVSRAADSQQKQDELLAEVKSNFQTFLKQRNPDKPFCYWFGPTNCHRKWIRGSGKALWGIDPEQLKGKLPPFLPDEHVIREDLADYLGEVQAFDTALGVLLKSLEDSGELERTVIIVSGDHGIPGFPRGKCNLYDFGSKVPLAIRWPRKFPGGRIVRDFVSLPDLAPTLLELGKVSIPDQMTARSLVPVLTSTQQGWVDPARDHVLIGRERHVAGARLNWMPYPQRAIRTREYLYIRNFQPERWPMGLAPGMGQPADANWPDDQTLEQNTFPVFADMDAGPTKAWLVAHRDDPAVRPYFEDAFGRRPAEELYVLAKDPHQVNNVAQDPAFQKIRQELANRLLHELTETGDPRVLGDGSTFDRPPYSSPQQRNPGKAKNKKPNKKPNKKARNPKAKSQRNG